jgi:pyrroline-5-carboxylate reductase
MNLGVNGPVVLVGAGNMGGAMLTGWLKQDVPHGSVIVLDPAPSEDTLALIKKSGATHVTQSPSDVKAGILFLAVKPQMMDKVLPGLVGLIGGETVVVSVAAGTTQAKIASHLGKTAAVRAMPNTPAMIGRGITGAFANELVSAEQKDAVDQLLRVSGPVEWVETETDIDAVTAVSGSGPAYVFYLVECMAEAGRKAGLPADLAMRLARETVAGAGELLHQSPEPAARLRQNVTSPGGTTAAALAVLMDDGAMQPLFDRAIDAAKQRAGELSA